MHSYDNDVEFTQMLLLRKSILILNSDTGITAVIMISLKSEYSLSVT